MRFDCRCSVFTFAKNQADRGGAAWAGIDERHTTTIVDSIFENKALLIWHSFIIKFFHQKV